MEIITQLMWNYHNLICIKGGLLGRLLEPFLKTGLPLIANVLKPLVKSISMPLGLTAAASATDADYD